MADGKTDKIAINLIGRLSVVDCAGKPVAVTGRKPQALLAYLALQAGRPQPRAKLATLLWGDRFDEQARQSLRQCVSKLRKALGASALVADGEQVTLDAGAVEIDTDRIGRLAGDGSPAALAEAADLCSAPLLDGLDVREAAFDEWLGQERHRFLVLACQVLERRARNQAAEGDGAGAIETARRLVSLDPLREEGHRLLMGLYAADGQRAAALKQYRTCADILRRELDTEPDAATRSLLEEIQAGKALQPAGTTEDATAPPPLPDRPSIAVLPFANLSGDPEQEYFSDGITDDLITALSNVRSFFIIDRHSSFVFKGRAVGVKDAGRDLGVRYVVEGSVRKAGNRVRVTAQLVEAATGGHVWADRYDGSLDDIFDLQDQIAASVVGAIEPQLLRVEVERVRQKRPESFDAYDLTLSGLGKMNKLNPKDTDDSLPLFLKAIELDPNYARAYVLASWCYRRRVQLNGMVLSDAEKAEAVRLARAALRADATDPYVLWQAGMTTAFVEKDLDAAINLIERSLSINANANRAWLASAIVRCFVGDPETAIAHAERAMHLSPLDVAMWVAFGMLGNAHMQLGDYETAASWARKAVRQHRHDLAAYYVLAASTAQAGHLDEARSAVRELLALDPEATITRMHAIYPVARYRNLEGFLDGLRTAGLPD